MLKCITPLTVALVFAVAPAWADDEVRAEFHQTYPLAADGRVAVSTLNGGIQISAWDRNEVKVDAVKRGHTQQDLDETKIVVDAQAGFIRISTEYPEQHNNHHGAVNYTISVPRGAKLDQIQSVNGGVTIDGVIGPVRAKTVNGKVEVRGAGGDVHASAVNGKVEAIFDRLASQHISLEAVNGVIALGLPKDAGARLKASTLHGGISSDFDLPVRHAEFGPGSSLESTIGNGGAEVTLHTVNGAIKVTQR
jgi:DUF4097 and DUF4098 domain-containing protein YvlB